MGNEKESAFVKKGYNSWRNAVGDKNKGFLLHEKSKIHLDSMLSYQDFKLRRKNNKEISTLVNDETLENNRFYVSALIDIVKFLAVEEMPFRGDETLDRKFAHLFEFICQRDSKLTEIVKNIPKTATYNSPFIQY